MLQWGGEVSRLDVGCAGGESDAGGLERLRRALGDLVIIEGTLSLGGQAASVGIDVLRVLIDEDGALLGQNSTYQVA